MPINELRSITTFIRTVETGSLSKAAAVQQISPQAASKALGQLEQHLGVRLFHRTTRSMSLTEEGQRFFEAVQPSLLGLQQALNGARQTREDLAGPLRIVGPRSVSLAVISPVLEEYCRLYPEVQPDIQLDDRRSNWVEERVDVGFRLGSSPEEGLIARPLFHMQMVICAAPSYLHKHGAPRSLDELTTHRCSAFRRSDDGRVVPWRVRVDGGEQEHPIHPAFCTNDEQLELHATLAGEIIAQIAVPTAISMIRNGRLVPLLLEHMTESYQMFIYYGSRQAQPARVRRFIDLAVERLENSSDYVLSRDELAAAANQHIAA